MIYSEKEIGMGEEWWRSFLESFPQNTFEPATTVLSKEFIKQGFDKQLGNGFMAAIHVEVGINAMIWDFCLNKDLLIKSIALDQNELFINYFTCTSTQIKNTTTDTNTQALAEVKGNEMIQFSSSLVENLSYIPAHTVVNMIVIAFTRDWFKNNYNHKLVLKDEFFSTIYEGTRPILLYRPLASEYKNAMSMLMQKFESPTFTSTLQFKKEMYELHYSFLYQLSIEGIKPLARSISINDTQLLLITERRIFHQVEQPLPTIKILSKEIGMSESKFKNLFKILFGASYYEYFLATRMEKAKNLIESGKMGVSVAGYYLGYKNLSNFSLAFKKHFGYLPSKVPKQC